MATVADIQSVPNTGKTAGKMVETVRVNGLTTPDGTPEPDDGRLEADRARLEADRARAAAAGAPPQTDAPKLEHARTESPPTGDSDSDNDDGESNFDSDENKPPPSDEQVAAVESVLSGKRSRKILGVQQSGAYPNPREEQESIMNAFRKLVALTHPVKNSHKDARAAFHSMWIVIFYFAWSDSANVSHFRAHPSSYQFRC
jgi:hypothetical protein